MRRDKIGSLLCAFFVDFLFRPVGKKENCRQIIKRNSALHLLVISCSYLIIKIIVYIVVFFKAKTPEQWESSTKTVPKSPPCMGGSKR